MKRLGRKLKRNRKGSLPTVFCLVILLVVLMFACLGVDVAHNTQVRDQLQTGTDAGALAGVRELAKDTPTTQDITNANTYAVGITAANDADARQISDNDPGTDVTVNVDPNSNIRTVTVVATRTVGNIFAYMIGHGQSQVSSRSVAGAYRGLSTVDPGGGSPLAIDIDHVPAGGAAAGQRINEKLTSGQTITIAFNNNNDSNAAWIKTWGSNATTNTSPITIGDSYALQNGVNNSLLSSFTPGMVINPILISGGPPYNQTRQAIGIISFRITATGKTNGKHWIKGVINEPIIIPGTPGAPTLNTTAANQNFINTWSPWQTSLIE